MKLTSTTIKNALPGNKPRKLSDGGGLYIEVHPNGRKYWRLKYRHNGKEKRLAVGTYPKVTLAQARKARDEAKEQLERGIDPSAEKQREKRERKAAQAHSFEGVAREWIARQAARWTENNTERTRQPLEKDIFPDLGARPINEIDAPELLHTLRKIEHRGAYETLQKVHQRCGAIFRYGISIGVCKHDVAADLRGAFTRPKTKNYAALSAADLPEFLHKLDGFDGHPQTKLALRLIILTMVRTGELRGARWDEFDLEGDEPMWRIPAERMKMNEEHLVPLSRQAVEVLKELKPLAGTSELVLPGRSSLAQPISENTMLYAMYRLGYHSRATVHGFRATASTILNEQGWRADVIERQLAHAERNAVRAAYNQAEYLPDRRRMLQAWADYLDSLTSENVVAFKKPDRAG